MNKYSLISSLFLATSCLVGSSTLQAGKFLIEKDSEIVKVGVVGRSKFIEDKVKQKLDTCRLSDKGDLDCFTSVFDPNQGPFGDYVFRAENPQRRRFYTIGDGDCYFWATDETRQNALNLWLQNSGNEDIRRLASAEIFDTFKDDIVGERMFRRQISQARDLLGPRDPIHGNIATADLGDAWENLQDALTQHNLDDAMRMEDVGYQPFPEAMRRNPLYVELKEAWNYNEDIIAGPEIYPGSRQDFVRGQEQLETRIKKDYCLNENIYRDYVTHCLSRRDQFMLSARDEGAYRTYFIDALEHIRDHNLIVWGYREGNRNALVKVHEYIKSPILETKEVILDALHYTRVVPIDNPVALGHTLNRENEYLGTQGKRLEKQFKTKIDVNVLLLDLHYYKDLAASPFFSHNVRNKHHQMAVAQEASLKKMLGKRNKLSVTPADKAAYYNALLKLDLKKAMKIREDIDIIESLALKGRMKELPALNEELTALTNKINFYTNCIEQLKIYSTDSEILDVLLQLSLHYGEIADQAQARSIQKGLSQKESIAAAATYQEILVLKNYFGEAFEEQQRDLNNSLAFQITLNCTEAQEHLKANLAKDLKLEDRHKYTDDYKAAKGVLDKYVAVRRNSKYVNPEYLSADPFLKGGEPDIDQVYPNNISNQDWNNMLLSLAESILYKLTPETEHAYISRYINTLIANNNPLGETIVSNNGLALNLAAIGANPWVAWNNGNIEPINVENYKLRINGQLINFINETAVAKILNNENTKKDLIEAFVRMQGIFSRLEIYNNDILSLQKNLGRKRFKRIIDTLEARAGLALDEDIGKKAVKPGLTMMQINGRVHAALTFAQHHGRCIDGIALALDQIENDLFSVSEYAEKHISNIFSSYAEEFCQKFALFNPNVEWATSAPLFAKQRTFFSLPYKGSPRTHFYSLNANVRAEEDGLFAPANLMRLFLEGGNPQYMGKTVRFEKFDHEKLLNLVYEAYIRGMQERPVGKIISSAHIQQLIERDEYLKRIYDEFLIDILEGEKPRHSDFFGDRHAGNEFKKPFFALLLERLGYIINPAQKIGAEKAAAQRLATAKQLVAEKAAAEKLAAQKLAAEKAAAQKLAAEKAAAQKLAVEKKAPTDKLETQKLAVEKKAPTDRLVTQKLAAEKHTAEKLAVENARVQKLKNAQLNEKEEKKRLLLEQLNVDFHTEEKGILPKKWQLVSSSSSQNKSVDISLKKNKIGIEVLGDNYTLYNNLPSLKDFDTTTFLFSVELRGTRAGALIQYWDGIKTVNSTPYNGNRKGEWETLSVEFTVDAKAARFHRLYAVILGPTKGANPSSIDIKNIKLQPK